MNTCYSLVAPGHGISAAGVYELRDGEIVGVEGTVGVSPIDASARSRAAEAQFAVDWFRNITAEMFN